MNREGEEIFLGWEESFQSGAKVVGGKGGNLGRLARYGFNVPVGGVLTTVAYGHFLEYNRLWERVLSVAAAATIDNINELGIQAQLGALRKRIETGTIPPFIRDELVRNMVILGIAQKPLAVRSSMAAEDSAKASFAGIHDSFLNVWGVEQLWMAIKGCYASLWTERAVAYRRRMGIADHEVLPAVVVMEMAEAVAAGVAFSCDPRSGSQDVLVVNANYGLGESVVGGAVEPDEYHLDANFLSFPLRVISKRIGRKEGMTIARENGGTEFVKSYPQARQVLSDRDIAKLGLLVLRVFEALGEGEQHQDIEWVFDGKDFIPVQARPVTVLPRCTYPELRNQPDIWSNANYRDSLPMVQSTLNWSIYKSLIAPFFTPGHKLVDYPLPPGLQHCRLFQGRLYMNLTTMQWGSYDAFGVLPMDTNFFLGGHQPEIEINERAPFAGIKGFKRIWRNARAFLPITRLKRNAPKTFLRVGNDAESWLKKDFTFFSDNELCAAFCDASRILSEYAPEFSLLLSSTSFPGMLLVKELEKLFPGKGHALANALMMGSAEITSAEHGYRLVEMAQIARSDADAQRFFSSEPFAPLPWEGALPDASPFKQAFRAYLTEYGHRGVYELDIINPRWREDPSYLLGIIRSMISAADLAEIKARQKRNRDKALQEMDRLPPHRRMIVRYWLKEARKGAELREMSKSVIVKPYELLRVMALEMGRRLEERGILKNRADVFHCAWHELFTILKGEWEGRGVDMLVAERKARRIELEAQSPPDLIIGEVPRFAEPLAHSSGNALAGMGVAAGRAEGGAKLIRHPGEGDKLQAGDVLVAPSTDPAWTPLFLRAAGIVMETGGFLSHGAIVAREYGIPAVVNIPGVLQLLEDGQRVVVDGDEGKVYLEN